MDQGRTEAEKVAMRQHVLALDGVRGLAIAMVLFYHLMHANPARSSNLLDYLQKLPGAMWVGVDLFFVLSGFLITGILYDSLGDDGFFPKFYGRRALRIFPLYYGVLFLLLLCTGPLQMAWEGREWALLLYLQNTRILVPLLDDDTFSPFITVSHLWSLAVEEQFYLVWPLVVFLVRDLRRLLTLSPVGAGGALLLRTLLTLRGVEVAVVYVFTVCRADSLLLGAALALALRTAWRARVLWAANAVMMVTAALLGAIAWRQGDFRIEHGPLDPDGRADAACPVQHGSDRICLQAAWRAAAHVGAPAPALSRPLQLRHLHRALSARPPADRADPLRACGGGRVQADLRPGELGARRGPEHRARWPELSPLRAPFLRLKRFFEYDPRTRALEASHGDSVLEPTATAETLHT